MHVGLFLDPYLTPESGGGYVITMQMLKALLHQAAFCSHKVSVYHWQKSHPLKEQFPDVAFHSLVQFPAKSGTPGHEDSALTELLRSHGLDFIWNLNALSCPTLKIPYSTMVWDIEFRVQPYFPELSEDGEWARREAMYKACLPRASAIVTGTKAGREQITRHFAIAPDRVVLLPHPTPDDCFDACETSTDLRTKYGLEELFIFYPAQFWSHKNHFGILSALRIIREKYDATPQTVFIGSDHGNKAHIRNLIQEFGLEDRVVLPGFVPRNDLIGMYKQALALVYFTHFGPENLPPLEAFALGCPVIASDVPGTEEQLGDAAVRCSPTDFEGLASAIHDFMEHPKLRQQCIDRGRIRANRFTSDDFADGVYTWLNRFERIRRCWPSPKGAT